MRKLLSIFLILLLSSNLIACRDSTRYHEDDPHFWTIAISSILGVRGREGDMIKVIEEDDSGRTMFSFYTGDSLINYNVLYAVVICQKFDEQYVYYYTDYNFVASENIEDITEEDIEKLKALNDWGKNISEEKLFRTKITRKKLNNTGETGDEVATKCVKEVFSLKQPSAEFDKYRTVFLVKDDYGRHIYFNRGWDRKNSVPTCVFVTIINKEGTYNPETCILDIDDIWDYQEELKAFKELNNWNKPLTQEGDGVK